MRHVLLGASFFLVTPAWAEPVLLDRSAAVTYARRDVGTGLCTTAIHYRPQPMNLTRLEQAIALLEKPAADPDIQGREVFRLEQINLRNATAGSEGDFTGSAFPDRFFPFSRDPAAMPAGDDINVALRLRGYLNVPPDRSGNPVTFGLRCDDVCSLSIGGKPIIAQAGVSSSERVTRQVLFQDSGLFPIEVVYFQVSGPAYLELSRALSAEPEGSQSSPLDPTRFQPIPIRELFSAVAGENAACQECGATGQTCAPGRYCGNGICQDCNLSAHCGPSCLACPAATPLCSAAECVECTVDAQCPAGKVCTSSKCTPPIPCTSDQDCSPAKLCQYDGCGKYLCATPDPPCLSDAMCPAGAICHATLRRCVPPVCPETPEPPTSYQGGCAAPGGAGAQTRGVPVAAFAALLLGLRRLRRSHARRVTGAA